MKTGSEKVGERAVRPARVTIERRGGACSGECFAVLVNGRVLGLVHSKLVADTLKEGIERWNEKEAA